MIYSAKGEELYVASMGKTFKVHAITSTIEEANDYMKKHDSSALIACFGPFNIIAGKYEGQKL